MLYAVCTHCAFLRAFSAGARDAAAPDSCPLCGSELVTHEGGRFQPTYIGRVSLDLHAAPALERGGGNSSAPAA